MPRTPKASDGEAPKKRTRKPTTEVQNGTKVEAAKNSAAQTAKPLSLKRDVAAPAVAEAAVLEVVEVKPETRALAQMPALEERVRFRAYEIYLRRGGRGGSPEQDWFQAIAEVYEESVA